MDVRFCGENDYEESERFSFGAFGMVTRNDITSLNRIWVDISTYDPDDLESITYEGQTCRIKKIIFQVKQKYKDLTSITSPPFTTRGYFNEIVSPKRTYIEKFRRCSDQEPDFMTKCKLKNFINSNGNNIFYFEIQNSQFPIQIQKTKDIVIKENNLETSIKGKMFIDCHGLFMGIFETKIKWFDYEILGDEYNIQLKIKDSEYKINFNEYCCMYSYSVI